MSHFSVLVVGDVDYNMAPFHEFECDGHDDEFIQTIDITERKRKEYEEALADQKANPDQKYGFKGSTFKEYLSDYCGLPFAKGQFSLDLEETHKYGYFYPVDGTEDDFKVFDRTNPNSFYDYYGLGWRGLKLKTPIKEEDWNTGEMVEATHTNHAFKRNIDFKGMWDDKEQNAREEYRKVIGLLGGTPVVKHTWSSLVDLFHPEDGSEPTLTRDEAVMLYESQEAVKLFKEKCTGFDYLFDKVENYAMTEDEYVASQHIHALTFGYVVNREYHSKGHMGWWAITWDEKDPNAWDKEYKEFIESLPDDAELSILDCHV